MTLIKFIEYQTKNHFLKKVPIELKLVLLVVIAILIFAPIGSMLFVYVGIFFGEILIMLIAFRDPSYVGELCFAYGSLFVIIYWIPTLWGKTISQTDILRFVYFMAFATASIIVFASTDIKQLEEFLIKIRAPRSLIKAIVLMWNLLPSTYAELNQIILTQKSRGLDLDNPIRKIVNSIAVLVPFLVIALIRMRYLTDSLRARGVS